MGRSTTASFVANAEDVAQRERLTVRLPTGRSSAVCKAVRVGPSGILVRNVHVHRGTLQSSTRQMFAEDGAGDARASTLAATYLD